MSRTVHKSDSIHPLAELSLQHDACGTGLVLAKTTEARSQVLALGLGALGNMAHRGGDVGDSCSDGSGVLFDIPWNLIRNDCPALPSTTSDLALGMFFVSSEESERRSQIDLIAGLAPEVGLERIATRYVPINTDILPTQSRTNCPSPIQLVFRVSNPSDPSRADDIAKRRLVLMRLLNGQSPAARPNRQGMVMVSLSQQTVVYKGLITGSQLADFYQDLASPSISTRLVLFHQRFATNTHPAWELAQPFEYSAHNGEINTIRANAENLLLRLGSSEAHQGHSAQSRPAQPNGGAALWFKGEHSDSRIMDLAIGSLVAEDLPIEAALSGIIAPLDGLSDVSSPSAQQAMTLQSSIFELWDGPAAIVFTDGYRVGAVRDRNGLRPLRMAENNDVVILASELGDLLGSDAGQASYSSLAPGEILMFEAQSGTQIDRSLLADGIAEATSAYASHIQCDDIDVAASGSSASEVHRGLGAARQHHNPRSHFSFFGFFEESARHLYHDVVTGGAEPTGSMGNDTRLPMLSPRPTSFFDFFRQRFAQVTNPPVDPVREACLFNMASPFGCGTKTVGPEEQKGSDGTNKRSRRLRLPSPILSLDEMNTLTSGRTAVICPLTYPRHLNLDAKVDLFCQLIEDTMSQLKDDDAFILITDSGVDDRQAAFPVLLAAAALHQRLVQSGRRRHHGLLVFSGQVRHSHDLACLFTLGVDGCCPYALVDFCLALRPTDLSPETALKNTLSALHSGLRKVMSRCGISQFQSYKSSCSVDVMGLSHDLCRSWLGQIQGRFGRLGLVEVIRENEECMDLFLRLVAGNQDRRKRIPKLARWSSFGEMRGFNPDTITALRTAVLRDSVLEYRRFTHLLERQDRHGLTVRGLLTLKLATSPLPVTTIEPESDILARLSIGAMSVGALSPEAHLTLARAAKQLGIKSNSGEGGEGDTCPSAIRQVASGRFGVTLRYLQQAKEIQIKIAQGAKPGEGGQLPGKKVTAEIAALRHTQPGVGLISPPPHHDIYSIEDLKQLIFDLRRVNPTARIGVKLVSSTGVGHIAVGVAKAGADTITIAGHDGGTGAAPLYSIYHVGEPWEIGLVETHDELNANGLRHKVRLVVDGQIRSGRDIVLASILGADEFSLATAPLVALGCMLMRKCHLNTCPVGIATQDAKLRGEFTGDTMHVVRLFRFLADEVREILARLGVRSLGELRAQRNLIAIDTSQLAGHWKTRRIDLRQLLFASMTPYSKPKVQIRQESGCTVSEDRLIHELNRALESDPSASGMYTFDTTVTSQDLTFGAALSSFLLKHPKGHNRLVRIRCRGIAGQSFAAFLGGHVDMTLVGAANDGVGKGMCGGKLVIKSASRPKESSPHRQLTCPSLAGNACFYGATSGTAFLAGRAGDRFAVRNSGAECVVDEVGDHGCEYMTGGTVVILGAHGKNLCAGMTGGRVYIMAPSSGQATARGLHLADDVHMTSALTQDELAHIHRLVLTQATEAESQLAESLVAAWPQTCEHWRRIEAKPQQTSSTVAPQKEPLHISRPAEARIGGRVKQPPIKREPEPLDEPTLGAPAHRPGNESALWEFRKP